MGVVNIQQGIQRWLRAFERTKVSKNKFWSLRWFFAPKPSACLFEFAFWNLNLRLRLMRLKWSFLCLNFGVVCINFTSKLLKREVLFHTSQFFHDWFQMCHLGCFCVLLPYDFVPFLFLFQTSLVGTHTPADCWL